MWQTARGQHTKRVKDRAGSGYAMRMRRRTYGDLGIRLQREGNKLGMLFICSNEGNGVL